MYGLYLLTLFFLLGVDAKRSDHDDRKNDDLSLKATIQNAGNSSTQIANFVLTSKQTRELESALNDVVRKLLGPQRGQLSLRTAEDENTGLIYTLRVISDAIRRQIVRLLERFGLIRSSKPESVYNAQPNDLGLKAAVYHQLLQVPLTMTSVYRSVQRQMRNHFQRSQYLKMGYKSSNFEFQMDYGTSTDQLKISAILGAISAYGDNLYACLGEREPTSFNLIGALGNLTNFSPEMTGKKLRSRLGKPIPKCPGKSRDDYNQFHAFICRAIGQDSRVDYYDCLLEVKRIEKCVHEKLNDSLKVNESATKSSNDFLRTIKNLDGTCRNVDKGMAVVVGCKLKTKARRSNSFPYVVNFFMGDLDKSPTLRRMANDVGGIITKSRMGSEALNEVVALIEIYKHGEEKKSRMLKASRRDFHQRSLFSRLSSILSRYKQHIYDVTHTTVAHVHNVVSTVEKILVDSASSLVGEDLSANVQTLRCWSCFVDSVFPGSNNQNEFPTIAQEDIISGRFAKDRKRHGSKDLIKVPNELGFMKSPHEEPLNKFIVSMKRLGRRSQPRRSTALMSLANTFLLATMFYECISLLAGAIYRDDSGSMSSVISAETEESDRWQSPRDRRSPSPIEEEDLQPQDGEDQEEPLSLTSEVGNVIATTVNPDRIQESVGNSHWGIFGQFGGNQIQTSTESVT